MINTALYPCKNLSLGNYFDPSDILGSLCRAEGHVTSTCLWHACRAVTIGALLIVMGMAMSVLGKLHKISLLIRLIFAMFFQLSNKKIVKILRPKICHTIQINTI